MYGFRQIGLAVSRGKPRWAGSGRRPASRSILDARSTSTLSRLAIVCVLFLPLHPFPWLSHAVCAAGWAGAEPSPAGRGAATLPEDLASAVLAFRQGEYDPCIQICDAAIQQKAWGEDWRVLKIKAELIRGKYAHALASYEQALEDVSASLPVRWLGVSVYNFNGQPEKAQQALGEIAEMIEKSKWRYSDAANRVIQGRYELSLGKDARQILEQHYDRAIREQPNYAPTHIAAGDLALTKHDYGLATEFFRNAVRHGPLDPDAWHGLGRALLESDDEQASEALSKAIELNPRHVPTLLLRAEKEIDAEAYDQAFATLQQVLDVNAWQPEAWALRAVIAHLRGDEAEEQACRAKGLKHWATNPAVDFLIGKKLSQKYRFAEGAAYQRRVLELDPQHRPAMLQLSQDLLRLGREREGWDLARRLFEEDPYSVIALNLNELHDRMESFESLREGDFLVRMSPREAKLYGREVLKLLQEAQSVLVAKYDVELSTPIVVEIFPQQQDFAIRTFGLPGGAGFLGVCFGQVITANSPASQGANPTNWESVLWHEFCHVVTLQKTKNKMPRWLSEGISVYEELERDRRWGQSMNPRFREMVLSDDLTPVSRLSGAFLRPATPLHLQFAYFESSLVVRYLIETYGSEALNRILVDLSVGMPINEALQRSTVSLARLDQDFAAYARKLAQEFGSGVDWEKPEWPPTTNPLQLAQLVASSPDNYWVQQRYAIYLIEDQQWDRAIEVLNKLHQMYPEDVDRDSALRLLAKVYRATDQVERERQTLHQVVDLDANAVDVYLRLLEMEAAAGNWNAVERLARQMIAVNPLLSSTYAYLGNACEQLDQSEEAIRAYTLLADLDPRDPAEIHFRLARLLEAQGEWESALRQVLKSLEEAPRFRDAHRLLRRIEQQQARPPATDAKPDSQRDPAETPPTTAPKDVGTSGQTPRTGTDLDQLNAPVAREIP